MSDSENTKDHKGHPTILTVGVGSSIPVDKIAQDTTFKNGGAMGSFDLAAQKGSFVVSVAGQAVIPHQLAHPQYGIAYAPESIPEVGASARIGVVKELGPHITAYVGAGARDIINVAQQQTNTLKTDALNALSSAIDLKQTTLDKLTTVQGQIDAAQAQITTNQAQLTALSVPSSAPIVQTLNTQATTLATQSATLTSALAAVKKIQLPDYAKTQAQLNEALSHPAGIQPFAAAQFEAHTAAESGVRLFVEGGGELGTKSRVAHGGAGAEIGRHFDGLPLALPGNLPYEPGVVVTPNGQGAKAGDKMLRAELVTYVVSENPYYADSLTRNRVSLAEVQAAWAVSDRVTLGIHASYGQNPSKGFDIPAPLPDIAVPKHMGVFGANMSVKLGGRGN